MKAFLIKLGMILGLVSSPAKKTAWGDPDLQGLWSNASRTSLETAEFFNRAVITPEEQRYYEGRARRVKDRFDTIQRGKHKEIIGYDSVWMDTDLPMTTIDGTIRASWIIDPPSGKIPYTPYGRSLLIRRLRDLYIGNEGPESRTAGERCLLGYGSVSGPPMINVDYNSNCQIVQSPGYVIIIAEMNHDARIIRLDGEHLPSYIRPWMGDSIGHWEGDTLVVETTNLNAGQDLSNSMHARFYLSPDSKVIERFTRRSPGEIFYEFEVSEPNVYAHAWKGEMLMRAIEGPLYEFACAEGDRSLEGILAGARREEKTKGRKQ